MKKTHKKVSLAKYGFGTGLATGIASTAGSFILGQDINALTGIGIKHNLDGSAFDIPEGGQIMAMGGILDNPPMKRDTIPYRNPNGQSLFASINNPGDGYSNSTVLPNGTIVLNTPNTVNGKQSIQILNKPLPPAVQSWRDFQMGTPGHNLPNAPAIPEVKSPTGKFAMGGTTGANAEVEGGEVAQAPNGQMMQFNGPSHEEGGIKTTLPQGTKIYSDRLAIDDKTMQQRKKSREKQLSKLNSILEKNPTDAINKNTADRMKNFIDMQEQQDLAMQDAANQIYQKMPQLNSPDDDSSQQGQYQQQQGQLQQLGQVPSAGVPQQGQPQFALGTDGDGVNDPNRGLYDGGTWGSENWNIIPGESYDNPQNQIDLPQAGFDHNYHMPSSGMAASNPLIPFPETSTPDNMNAPAGRRDKMPYTTGDETGFIGNLVGGVAPLATTLANRAGDTPNVNSFKNFGVNAVNANKNAIGLIGSLRNKNLTDLETNAAGQRMRNRNSAGSVNTSRALDLATTAQENAGIDNVYASHAQQMAGLYSEQSKLDNQQDLYTSTGAQGADRANRMDRDSYYTNLGQNFSGIAKTIQNTGKEMNEHQYSNDILDILPNLNKYGVGFSYDESGKLQFSKMKAA